MAAASASASASEARLRAIARSATDASGYFPALYARVTNRVAARAARGTFEDAARMDRFITVFAGYYLRAVERTVPAPRCWAAAWEVAGRRDLLVVQHLLLGINAHVNHDLALAVVELAGDGDLTAIRADFHTVNDVLAEAYVDAVRDLDRVSRWTNEVAAVGGSSAFNFSLRVARRRAWHSAQLLHGQGSEADRRAYVAALDDAVSGVAYVVTRTAPPLRPLVWLARHLEERDPRRVTAALLGEA